MSTPYDVLKGVSKRPDKYRVFVDTTPVLLDDTWCRKSFGSDNSLNVNSDPDNGVYVDYCCVRGADPGGAAFPDSSRY